MIRLPIIFVGVHCPIEEIWNRREATWGQNKDEVDEGVRLATYLSQNAANFLSYDLKCDTSKFSSKEWARMIGQRIDVGLPKSAILTTLQND